MDDGDAPSRFVDCRQLASQVHYNTKEITLGNRILQERLYKATDMGGERKNSRFAYCFMTSLRVAEAMNEEGP